VSRADDIFKAHGTPILKTIFGVAVTLIAHRRTRAAVAITAVGLAPVDGQHVTAESEVMQTRKCLLTVDADDVAPVDAWSEVVIDGTTWNIEQPPVEQSAAVVVWQITEIAKGAR